MQFTVHRFKVLCFFYHFLELCLELFLAHDLYPFNYFHEFVFVDSYESWAHSVGFESALLDPVSDCVLVHTDVFGCFFDSDEVICHWVSLLP